MRKDGERFYASGSVRPLRDEKGVPTGYLKVCEDVTARHETRRALRASEARFRAVVAAVSGVMWTNNARGEMEGEQAAWGAFTGQTREDYQGYGWARAVHPEDANPTVEAWRRAVAERRRFDYSHRVRRADGAWRWCAVRAVPVLDERGEPREWVGVHTDITEEREARELIAESERRYRALAADLERLVGERTAELRGKIGELEAFSYSLSHDLRAPLRAMHGFADALLEEHSAALDEVGRDYVRRIARAARRMDLLVCDVLTYSRLTQAEFGKEPVELEPLMRDLVDALGNGRGAVELAGPLPCVQGHAALLGQMFSNLLDKALKFAAPGRVARVRVRAERRGECERVWVEDNGVGIAPEHQARIFEIFGRVYPDNVYEGTGIGLAIVRKAAERLGATVGVESGLGAGSRFWVDLPAATAAAPETGRVPGNGGAGAGWRGMTNDQ